ncbi:MAG: hypothetical protein GXC78_15500 [Chitinophagaceae bacterium]|jgi:hypothetical protein|nr:hypothetical protein [Chitinophagaceae bacterium]
MQSEINTKEFLNEILSIQKQVSLGIELKIDETYNDSELLSFFSFVQKEKIAASSTISEKIADYCQLLQEEKNYKNIPLEMIYEVYKNASINNPFDISLYESLSYYLDAVLDKPEEAKRVLVTGIKVVEEKLNEVKDYLQTISADKE